MQIMCYFYSIFKHSFLTSSSDKDGNEKVVETYTDEQIKKTIDSVIEMMDKDNDGFINYHEFMTNNKT